MSHADAVMLRSLLTIGVGPSGYLRTLASGKSEFCEALAWWEDVLDTMDSIGNVDLAEETDRQEALEDA